MVFPEEGASPGHCWQAALTSMANLHGFGILKHYLALENCCLKMSINFAIIGKKKKSELLIICFLLLIAYYVFPPGEK